MKESIHFSVYGLEDGKVHAHHGRELDSWQAGMAVEQYVRNYILSISTRQRPNWN